LIVCLWRANPPPTPACRSNTPLQDKLETLADQIGYVCGEITPIPNRVASARLIKYYHATNINKHAVCLYI
jgi:hypothetical protein